MIDEELKNHEENEKAQKDATTKIEIFYSVASQLLKAELTIKLLLFQVYQIPNTGRSCCVSILSLYMILMRISCIC